MAASYKINFADCYVLTSNRTQAFIQSFLDTFLPHRTENTSTYTIPQFSDQPEQNFTSATQLIAWLEENPNEPHAIYWSNTREERLRGAMCIFTSDDKLIVGLYCETLYPDDTVEKSYLKALMNFCKSDIGLIEYETPAAEETADFLQRVQTYKQQTSQ